MKINEIIVENRINVTEGARIAHAEDLVFFEGSAGALRAINNLTALTKSKETLSIKWDGCIHPDHILQTDQGELRIEEVVDRVNVGESLFVLGHDLTDSKNVMTEIVNAVKKHGGKDWVEVELENGDLLRLTEDHEVYTNNRGWVEAKNLTPEDDIKEL